MRPKPKRKSLSCTLTSSIPRKYLPASIHIEYYKKAVARFGEQKAEKFERMAQEFGVPDLAPLIAKYGHEVRG
jgi:hypothetical protein